MSGKAPHKRDLIDVVKAQQKMTKKAAGISRANASGVVDASNGVLAAGKNQSSGAGAVNINAGSDLNMHTYDIVDVDRLKFSVTKGSTDQLLLTDTGIESNSYYNSSTDTYYSIGMRYQIPTNQAHLFAVGSGSDFIIYDGLVHAQNPFECHSVWMESTTLSHVSVPTTNGTLYYDGTDVKAIIPTGTINLTAGTSGANTTLSNLGTTAINADLDPASDNVRCLGSSTKRWDKLYTGDVWTTYLTGNTDGEVKLVGDFVPFTDNTYDLGTSTKEWKDLYLDGIAYIDTVSAGHTTTGTFQTTNTSNLGDGATDQVNFYGKTDWKTNVTSSSATTGSREGYITIKINGTDKKLYYYA